jgi:RNA polymerase sigma-70 factor (ECF subfamily)
MNGATINATGFTSAAQDVSFTPPLSAEQVYHDYAPRVYHLARRMVSNDMDAEDVTQDVLLQVVRKLPTFRGESAFPTWLHRITVNAAIAHRRKVVVRETNRSHDPFDSLLEDESIVGLARKGELTPDDQLVYREAVRLIEKAIAGLPEVYREVFLLSDVDGIPNADIAERFELSLPAVKSRLHRARQLLKETLAPYFD